MIEKTDQATGVYFTLVSEFTTRELVTIDERDLIELAAVEGIDLEAFRLTEDYLPWLYENFSSYEWSEDVKENHFIIPGPASENLEALRQAALGSKRAERDLQ